MARPGLLIDDSGASTSMEGRAARFAAAASGAWTAVRRHRIILFVTMALCVLAGVVFILLSTPDYRATASVEVEDVPAGAAGAAAAQRQATPSDNEALMQTELEVLRSRALAEDVARELALIGSRTFFDGMNVRRPEQGTGALSQRQVETETVVGLLRDNLHVELPGKSRVIRISFTSADPVLSARVANSYADSLIRADLKRGFESGVQARRFLLGELDGARKDLERAERDLAVYAANAGAMALPGSREAGSKEAGSKEDDGDPSPEVTIATRLAQLNAFRAQATADRIAAQKRWESARMSSVETLPEVLNNGAMQQIMTERAQARAQVVQERQFRKDAHPEMREARARLAALDDQAEGMANTIRASLKEQFDVAVHGEKQIQSEIAKVERQARAERGRGVQMSILERQVDTYRLLHDSLLQRYRDMASQAGFQAGRIQPLDRAAVPSRPSSPNIGVTMLFASLGGLILGLMAVAGRHIFDDAVTSADTLVERVNLPLLGAVPAGEKPGAEIFAPMASSLLLGSAAGLPRSILVTSAQEGEGKSSTLHALARALAKLDKRVLVIDADMRRPKQHSLFGISPARGISELMTGQARMDDVIVDSGVPGVALLPCGAIPPNPAELLVTPAMDSLLATVRERYDTVLIDAPPILGLSDACLLASKAQVTLLVVEWGRNHHGGLRVAVDRLRRAGGAIIGAILTKQEGRAFEYDYHRGG
ncbi:protein tyrosine kinase [Sphingobium sp. 22B]|uniref:GumC family protein n=1 Tax=unclassified Sphingobium TaxID=2611147 RepID=UPI0007867500|nr:MULTISPECIES: polysaccharide biosynthesis tyrosine autokinase [unclassified Sphingobium]KXU29376.1 protein tyrosine kinase [Sphingobium sp. AM]KYC33040.1 protein tyrosine kinase [Sphingobium sp. 22B]OAP29353.1 protein tyrosine kinase [Sphingobium sp. 20006FA]